MSILDSIFPYAATTEGITVRVQPTFLAEHSRPDQGLWVWHYHVRIENGGTMDVRLLDRHWIIIDGRGVREDVEGPGVVGEQPLIAPGSAHDYVSGCPLSTPSGTMEGSFGMIDGAGRRFRVAIPLFDLVSPHSRRAGH
ncbi:Co2+/Mg2+ efflux protein ApaG [Thermaurantiacus sp.]